MIDFKQNDLFQTEAEALVNTVNCVGVMGRGIALQCKKRYPENFRYYAETCKRGEMAPGKVLVYETGAMTNPRYIINFPTKRHWRMGSRMDDIESGLQDLAKVIVARKIRSIAVPPLGCGLGGLDWNVVKQKILAALGGLSDVRVEIYEPGNTPEASQMVDNRPIPSMTPGRAALIVLIKKYLEGLMDPFVTLLEVHKLLYFLQDCGENLRLQYTKNLYGPYAENLRHVLNLLEGHFISGYADGGDNPKKELVLLPGAYAEGVKFLQKYPETLARMNKVCALVEGFETSFGLELLATVHWLVKHEGCCSISQIIRGTYQWNEHKKQFSERQLKLATARLVSQGWIGVVEGVE